MSRARFRRGRRRRIPKVRADGRFYGYGPEEVDAKSGWSFPKLFMASQIGRLVSKYYRDNSFDLAFSDRLDSSTSQRAGVPLISVTASIATATEAGPVAGQFTLTRRGDSSTAFNVTVGLGGTAVMGTHYLAVPFLVAFAAGQTTATVTITPIVGGLGAATSVTAILTAVADNTSNYYPDYTATAQGPGFTPYNSITTLLNQATVTITH